jgi:hypothetical protein
MKSPLHEEPKIVAAVERQLRSWVQAHESEHSTEHPSPLPPPHLPARAISFVTISREAGANGEEIGRLVGQRLGWEVLDRALLDQMAQRFRESRGLLEMVDETPGNWAYDVVGAWLDRQVIPHEKFVAQLSRVVRTAARRGKLIFVGRGAQFLLPRDKVLAVRLVASERYRVAQIMAAEGLGEADARQFMHDTDEGRRKFVKRFFRRDISDPHLYDLVINSERCGLSSAAAQIVAATIG